MTLPYTLRLGVALFRQTLRTIPRSMLVVPNVEYLQPLINKVGFPSLTLPAGVTVEPDTVAGVPGEWLLPDENSQEDTLLLWAHGGGFMFCSPGTHRQFLARVALRSQCAVFCPDYRKPPTYPFPTPHEDVWTSFKALRGGKNRIFVGGDSAGGNLALEVARLALEEDKAAGSAGVVLLSPWVDLTDTSSKSWVENQEIDFIPSQQAGIVAEIYAGDTPLEDPVVSPARRLAWPEGRHWVYTCY